jgi:hypothetical protein
MQVHRHDGALLYKGADTASFLSLAALVTASTSFSASGVWSHDLLQSRLKAEL